MGYLTGHRMGIQSYIRWVTPWASRVDFPCPALTPASYICGLFLFSCLVLHGLTSFSLVISSTRRSDIIQSFSERCVAVLGPWRVTYRLWRKVLNLTVHIDTLASSARPVMSSGSYIGGLPLFSCLVLDGLTSFSVLGAGSETRT
jgi:hypothetical protein